MTIFAARRVLPPLLMMPAKASKPFMKLTGPDDLKPPLVDHSLLERRVEKLVPVPEPNLKSNISVLARSVMLSILSPMLLMKQAEHCGCLCTPTLNQTADLKGAICPNSSADSSSYTVRS